MQSHDPNRSVISGRARGLGSFEGTAEHDPASSVPNPPAERSGSRVQLDRAFRRITLVGAHQSSLRRSGIPGRII